MGAPRRARVTGVDFSEPAIAFARELAAEVGLADDRGSWSRTCTTCPGRSQGETFDVVYTSRGVLGWLPDIARWAEVVAGFVEPGGTFYIHEAHPSAGRRRTSRRRPNDLRLGVRLLGRGDATFPVQGSYADPDADVDADVEHGWNHSLGEIVTRARAQRAADRAPRREAAAGLAGPVPGADGGRRTAASAGDQAARSR